MNFPKRVYLLRGNHETRKMTTMFSFREECLEKYDEDIYNKINDYIFDALPLVALVNNLFLCVHGGISRTLHFI